MRSTPHGVAPTASTSRFRLGQLEQMQLRLRFADSGRHLVVRRAGKREAVETVLREFRVYSRKVPGEGEDYTMDHTALVYLMDKQWRFVRPFRLDRKPEEAAAELSKYL